MISSRLPIAISLYFLFLHTFLSATADLIYVANLSLPIVSVIDTGTNTVIATIVVGVGPLPLQSPGASVYVANKSRIPSL